jgi:hypothetical protein
MAFEAIFVFFALPQAQYKAKKQKQLKCLFDIKNQPYHSIEGNSTAKKIEFRISQKDTSIS